MVTTVVVAFLFLLFLPFAVAVGSTYILLRSAKMMEVAPHDVLGKVHIYIQKIRRKDGLAYSMWLPWKNIVVLDAVMLLSHDSRDIQFIIAHEIGHLVLGHCEKSFWRLVTMECLMYPATHFEVFRDEAQADEYARGITGHDMSTG